MKNSGFSELASVFDSRMREHSKQPYIVELGGITANKELKTDSFPEPIPKNSYYIARSLTLGKKDETFTKTGTVGDHGEASVKIPEKMRTVKPGDRVLVVWAGPNHADPVVVDIVLEAEEVKF